MSLPAHLFASDDGNLYDTRDPRWSQISPLRTNFMRSQPVICNTADLRATLRNGDYAWPGGYPLYFVMMDGEAMSFAAVRANLRDVLGAIHYPKRFERSWRPNVVSINWEDGDLRCAHSGERIPSAYADENA